MSTNLGLGILLGFSTSRAGGGGGSFTPSLVVTPVSYNGSAWVSRKIASLAVTAGRTITMIDDASGQFSYGRKGIRLEKPFGPVGTSYNCTIRESDGVSYADTVVTVAVQTQMPAGLDEWLNLRDLSKLWKDTSKTIPVAADGDVIASWTGSIAGWEARQATTANQPLYKVNIENGLPGAFFDGVNDFMDFITSAAQGYMPKLDTCKRTVIATVRPASFAATRTIMSFANGATYGPTMRFNTSSQLNILFSGSTSGTDAQVLAANQTHVVAMTIEARGALETCKAALYSDGVSTSVISNGDPQPSCAAATVATSAASTAARLGAGAVTTVANYFSGHIMDVFYFNRVLTKSEIEDATRQISDYYNLTPVIPQKTYLQPWDTSKYALVNDFDFKTDFDAETPAAGNAFFHMTFATKTQPTGFLPQYTSSSPAATTIMSGGALSDEVQVFANSGHPNFYATAASSWTDGVYSAKDDVLRINLINTPPALIASSAGYLYTAGGFISHGKVDATYGIWEWICKLPTNIDGMFAAMWFMASQSAWKHEIDLHEQKGVDGQGQIISTLHDQNTFPMGQNVAVGTRGWGENASDDFHKFSIKMTAAGAECYQDDVFLYIMPIDGGVRAITAGSTPILEDGTITCTTGSAVITGTGTAFASSGLPGQHLMSGGVDLGVILSRQSTTQITLTANASANVTGGTFNFTTRTVYASNFALGQSVSQDPIGGNVATCVLTLNASGVVTGYNLTKQGSGFFHSVGTATTDATAAVVGVGTRWTSADVGQPLYIKKVNVGTIQSVTDFTHLTLVANATQVIASGIPLVPTVPKWFKVSAFTVGQEVSTGTIVSADVGPDLYANAYAHEPRYFLTNFATGSIGGDFKAAIVDGANHFDIDRIRYYKLVLQPPPELTVGYNPTFDGLVTTAANAVISAFTRVGDSANAVTQAAIRNRVRRMMAWKVRPDKDNPANIVSDWDQTQLSRWDAHQHLYVSSTSEAASGIDWKNPSNNDLTKFGAVTWNIATGWTFPGSVGAYLEGALAWDAFTQFKGAASSPGQDCSFNVNITVAPSNSTNAPFMGIDASSFFGGSSTGFSKKLQASSGASTVFLATTIPITTGYYSASRGYRSSEYLFLNGGFVHGASITGNQVTPPTAALKPKYGSYSASVAGSAYSANVFGVCRRTIQPENEVDALIEAQFRTDMAATTTLLPTGFKMVWLGNSMVQAGEGGASTTAIRPQIQTNVRGSATWLNAIWPYFKFVNFRSTDSRPTSSPRYFSGANQGIVGDTITARGSNPGMLSRVPDCTAIAHDVLNIDEAINTLILDASNPTAAADAVTAIKSVLDAYRATSGFATKMVVIHNCAPFLSTTGGNNSTLRNNVVNFNALLAAAIVTWPGYGSYTLLYDKFTPLMAGHPASEFAGGTYYPPTSMYYDNGLHVNGLAAYIWAKGLRDLLIPFVDTSGLNIYQSAWAAGGNINLNPLNTGTTGTKANGVTGTVPTNITVTGPSSNPNGSTYAHSMESNAETGGFSMVMNYNVASRPSTTSETCTWTWNTIPGAGNNFGGTTGFVEAWFEIEDSGSGIPYSIECRLNALNPSSNAWSSAFVANDAQSPARAAMPSEQRNYFIKCHPVQLDGTTTDGKMSVILKFNPDQRYGAGWIKIKRVWIGNATDPRPDWNG